MLGASSVSELAATILTMVNGIIPPTINYENPDPECDLDYVPNQAREAKVKAAISKVKDNPSHDISLYEPNSFYEPEEEQRMGVLRVEMAKEAGANVIVTACPFCLVNIEDAIKVAGLEGQMEAIDLCELASRQVDGIKA